MPVKLSLRRYYRLWIQAGDCLQTILVSCRRYRHPSCPCNIHTSSETVSGFTKYGCDDLAENNSLKEEGSPDVYKVSAAGYLEQREEEAGFKVRTKTWMRN